MLSKLVQSPVTECGISSIYPTLQSPSVQNPVLLPLLKHLTLKMAGPISGMQITGAVPSFFEDAVQGFLLPMAPTILDNVSATMHVGFFVKALAILMLSFVQRSVQRYSIPERETYGWT